MKDYEVELPIILSFKNSLSEMILVNGNIFPRNYKLVCFDYGYNKFTIVIATKAFTFRGHSSNT